MREFALLRLLEADEEEAAARNSHLAYFAASASSPRSMSHDPDVASRLAWLDELDLEADNIRAALRHCLADPDGADLGLAMAAGLGQYWRNRAVSEGAHWIDALLARHGSDDAIRSEALFVKIDLAVVKGDHAAGLDAAAEAGAIARRLNADALLVRILANQAALQVLGGRPVGRSGDLG